MGFVITDEIFPVKYLKSQSITKLDVFKSQSITKLDVLVLPNSMSFVVSCHRKQNDFSLKCI